MLVPATRSLSLGSGSKPARAVVDVAGEIYGDVTNIAARVRALAPLERRFAYK